MDQQTSHLSDGTSLGNGKYKILRFIGAGGFGCTYEAEFTIMHSKVAIKEFFVGSCCNRGADGSISVGTQSQTRFVAQLEDKFIREARSLFRLSHPNIVHVSDVIQENGTSYYVMDYIDGRSLQEIVDEDGPISEDRALRYISQLMDALEYVHSQKMLHLDIKPDNIMIDKNDNAILIDFGVSKQYDEVDGHNTSTIMGQTPGFAPLEQITNTVKQFTPATDIYALGATLYAILTGETPPPTADLMAGLARLKPLPQGVKQNTRMAIGAMMQPKRDLRPQSIDQVRKMLSGVSSPRVSASRVSHGGSVMPPVVLPPVPPVPPGNSGNSSSTVMLTGGGKPKKKSSLKLWIWIGVAVAVATFLLVGGLILLLGKSGSHNYDDDYYYGDYEYVDSIEAEPVEVVEEYEVVPAAEEVVEAAVEEVAPAVAPAPAAPVAPTTGTANGHTWVDMGTSVYWATTNVGSSTAKGDGGYYAWAESNTKGCYDETTSRYYGNNMTSIAGSSRYDCATINWGGKWRMPTKAECQELINKCTWSWYGSGMKVTAGNGNVIYLPAAGFYGNLDEPLDYQKSGYCWTATPYDNESAWSLTFDANGARVSNSDDARFWGMTIRPVMEK